MNRYFPRCVGVLALSTLLQLVACDANVNEREALANAKTQQDKGEAAEAFLLVKSVLKDHPESAAARFRLGLLLLDQGEAAAAEIELRKALDGGQAAADTLPPLLRAMNARGEFKKVLAEFGGRELPDASANADVRVQVAIAYAKLGQKDKAREIADVLLKVAPKHSDARLLDAQLLASAGNYDAALDRMTAAVAQDANSASLWEYLGDLRMYVKGDIPGAAQAYTKVIALRPRAIHSQSALIAIALRQRDLKSATSQLSQMRKVLPQHPQTKLFEAQLAFLNNEPAKTRDICQQLLRTNPDNLLILQMLGAAELQLNALVQAETYLSKVSSIAPELDLARRLLGQTYLRMGQPNKALAAVRPTIDKPNTPAETLEVAAEVFLNLGDSATAEALYAKAAKVKPDDPKIRTAMALVQFSKGQDEAALNALNDIAATDRGTVADLALISTRLRRNELDQALAAIDTLTKKTPDAPIPYNLKGRVQLLRKDAAAARKSFETALSKDPGFLAAAGSLAELDLSDKQPQEAYKRFEAVLKVNPRNTAAAISLAEIRLRTGAKRTEVTPLLEAAVKANPSDPTARVALVDNLLASNDPKGALAAAQQGLSSLPNSPEVLDALGRCQQTTAELNQAQVTFSKLAILLPKSAQPVLKIARVQLAKSEPEAALQSLRRALDLEPRLPDAQRLLITTAISLKRPREALDVAKSMQRQFPDDAVGYQFAGDVLSQTGDWTAAAEAYRQGLTKANRGNLANRVHMALSFGKKAPEAQRFADGWLKEHPRDGGFLYYLGDLAVAAGDAETALMRYREVLKLEPENAYAMNNIAFMLLTQKKPGAKEMAERANQLVPDNPPLLDTLALVLAESGEAERAVATAKRCVELAPYDQNYRLTLARVYLRTGDKVNAKTELSTLLQTGRSFRKYDEVDRLLKTL